jgi:hypothetical protein
VTFRLPLTSPEITSSAQLQRYIEEHPDLDPQRDTVNAHLVIGASCKVCGPIEWGEMTLDHPEDPDDQRCTVTPFPGSKLLFADDVADWLAWHYRTEHPELEYYIEDTGSRGSLRHHSEGRT